MTLSAALRSARDAPEALAGKLEGGQTGLLVDRKFRDTLPGDLARMNVDFDETQLGGWSTDSDQEYGGTRWELADDRSTMAGAHTGASAEGAAIAGAPAKSCASAEGAGQAARTGRPRARLPGGERQFVRRAGWSEA